MMSVMDFYKIAVSIMFWSEATKMYNFTLLLQVKWD